MDFTSYIYKVTKAFVNTVQASKVLSAREWIFTEPTLILGDTKHTEPHFIGVITDKATGNTIRYNFPHKSLDIKEEDIRRIFLNLFNDLLAQISIDKQPSMMNIDTYAISCGKKISKFKEKFKDNVYIFTWEYKQEPKK